MREWIEPPEIAVPEPLRGAVGGHPLVAQTLVRRGFTAVDTARAFLDPDCYRPAPASDLPNVDEAASRLEQAVRERERVCVWGDFDVDGQTATTILVTTLRDLGADVEFHIPHRQRESHGVHLPILEELIAAGVKVVLTCDTGVTAHEAVAHARARGVDVIVTDHHDLPPVLPDARAVVNPKMLPAGHPLRELPGVGVAFKLVEALYTRVGRPEASAQHLDLLALGIVADVAVQTGDVRYLLQRGLEALRGTERLGLRVMMDLAGLTPAWLTEEHIGFVLAPRLNALGRLSDASDAVEFLTTQDVTRARTLASTLEGLNAQRKLLSRQVAQAAELQIERDPSLLDGGALVLSHPSWPGGVLGIVAGRLATRHNRPTILITTPPGELGRGSARSVEGCDISAAIAAHADVLVRFGGHPMAAGLSIEPERIPAFRRALSRTVSEMLGEVREEPALEIDGYLSLADLSLDLVRELERLAPFGLGNPPLTLVARGLTLANARPIGRDDEHLLAIVEDKVGTTQKVVWWQGAGEPLPQGRFDLAYVARTSDYRGQREVQVEWVDARHVEPAAVVLVPAPRAVEVVDYRWEPNPRKLLNHVRAGEDVQVWSEAGERAAVEGLDRRELGPSPVLAIWTIPPGPVELQAVLEAVSPQRVVLFAIDPGLDGLDPFLTRLAGLVKRALRSSAGRVSVETLAAATAQRETTVRAGIEWLVAKGYLAVLEEDGEEIRLAKGDGASATDASRLARRLKQLLGETAAYRAYFTHAEAQTLVSS
jgi:single-stranded-DNA-specific exonuclease